MQEVIPSQESLILKFHGDSSIDAAILGRSITNMALIAREVTTCEGVANDFAVRVETFEKGSFEVVFSIMHQTAQVLAPHVTLPNAQALVTTIKSFFETKKLLRGEKPKNLVQDEKHMKLSLPDGTTYEGPPLGSLVFKRKVIDGLVSEISELALNNRDGDGFSLIDNTGESFYSTQDAKDIAIRQEFTEFADSESVRSERVLLPLKSPDFLGSSRWGFQYGRQAISATIGDHSFLNEVHSRNVAMQAGDKLDVELETTTKKSPSGEILGMHHTVTKVHCLVSPPNSEQTKLPEV